MTLLEAAYAYVLSILNAEAVSSNAWLAANIDKVQGIATIIICSLVVVIAIAIGIAVLRWFGSLFRFGR